MWKVVCFDALCVRWVVCLVGTNKERSGEDGRIVSYLRLLDHHIQRARFSKPRYCGSESASAAFSDVPIGVDVELGLLDDHVVSGLLKLWLRHLPDPLIPFSSYDAFSDVLSQRT